MAVETCGCGCGTLTVGQSDAHESCGCGCGTASSAPKTPEQEIAELQELRKAIDTRLGELTK